MILVMDTINLDVLNDLESFIFLMGLIITASYVLLFKWSRVEEKEEEEAHYYGRHNVPVKKDYDE